VEYFAELFPAGVPRYGLTSGLPSTLAGLVGENGAIHGLDHFGYSAPYKTLDEKFGFSGAAVCKEVLGLLGR
jgi:transketolase